MTHAERLEAIKSRAKAATPGDMWPHFGGEPLCRGIGLETIADFYVEADAEFYRYARTDIPYLVARVEELTAALEHCRFLAASHIEDLRYATGIEPSSLELDRIDKALRGAE